MLLSSSTRLLGVLTRGTPSLLYEGNFIDLTNGSFDNIYFIEIIVGIIIVIKDYTHICPTKGTFKGAANYK